MIVSLPNAMPKNQVADYELFENKENKKLSENVQRVYDFGQFFVL